MSRWIGTVQVNSKDYGGRVVVELDQNYESPAVPAWDERGQPDLCGPFSSHAEASKLLLEQRDYLEWCGYKVRVDE